MPVAKVFVYVSWTNYACPSKSICLATAWDGGWSVTLWLPFLLTSCPNAFPGCSSLLLIQDGLQKLWGFKIHFKDKWCLYVQKASQESAWSQMSILTVRWLGPCTLFLFTFTLVFSLGSSTLTGQTLSTSLFAQGQLQARPSGQPTREEPQWSTQFYLKNPSVLPPSFFFNTKSINFKFKISITSPV